MVSKWVACVPWVYVKTSEGLHQPLCPIKMLIHYIHRGFGYAFENWKMLP